jgi:hypothetical protein
MGTIKNLIRVLTFIVTGYGAPFLIAVLDAPIVARLAAIAVWLWLVVATRMAFQMMGEFAEQTQKHAYWARLTFITLHLRNEHEGLPPAKERLRSDMQEEEADKWARDALAGDVANAGAGLILFVQMGVAVCFLVALAFVLKEPVPVRDWIVANIASLQWPAHLPRP